ncbi:CRISPR-associated endonuclease Cas1 [Candidatus Bathyarchaeota archaeon]|nr:CRISPR-associated endonuclease Cas1 [Candidatus Bathyarchaeota archaeon]
MKRLVVDGFGKFVGKHGERIVVREKGKTLHQTKVEDLRQVVISGSGSISFDAMELLGSCGVDLIIINWKGEVTARLASRDLRTVQTRREQYYAYREERSGFLAKQFIVAKMRNQYATLGTLAKSRRDTSPEVADKLIEKREAISNQIEKVESIEVKPIDQIRNLLMGLEGFSSTYYWEAINEIIPEEFNFNCRSGRYAGDPVNALLNYGYALLEGEVWRGVHYAGLDPYGGFLHVDRPGRPSMVLDLMEEFRQQLIDKTVIGLVAKGEIKISDFSIEEGICKMGDQTRKLLLKAVLERFERYVRYKDEQRRWTDMILIQARDVASFLRGELRNYEGFYLRW